MIYIYDILVNFNDNRIYDFYEWNEKDEILNIKKIKLFKIESNKLNDLINNKCIVENDLLNKIDNSCELYNKSKNKIFEYTCLLSDGNIVIAIKFTKNGLNSEISKLLLEEENEISILANNLETYDIKYEIIKKISNQDKFLTRNELSIHNYLLKEINECYDKKDFNKLKYLYQEYYDKDNNSNKDMYDELINSLNNIDNKHKYIYNFLIKLKKQV